METKVIHSGQEPDPVYGGVSVPIYQSSTFAFQSVEQGAARFAGLEKGYIYTRIANPTIKALEDRVASLENGYGGIATSSGMAAISTIIFGLLEKGSHLISTASVYGSTRVMIENLLPRFGISADFTDTSNLDNIRKLIRPTTKILFIETPANPTLVLTDIAACATLAQEENLTLVVDNTFASPILQNPLNLGADIVVHSVTKFLNGHSDVVGGIIIPRDEETYQKMHKTMTLLGGNMDPHQAWLVLRGIQTLAIRVQKSQENALKLAQFLSSHPKVAWVNYPGLPSHPQHELAQRQMRGFGAMICFGLKGGYEAGKKMINSVRVATLAVSLGGVESLIQHPASMTHAGVPQEEKEQAGITEDLIRLSVGCEGYEDLRSDLEQALEKV
ncbi:MAG: methionine gamma-lyase [Candidatus Aminicenantes bacterium 4484_214]|nr:MAG: methionine gamma-lyase [Candidatus Aminicenantes bacterium 4484_214]